MKAQLLRGDSSSTVTALYTNSIADNIHDELDFELWRKQKVGEITLLELSNDEEVLGK